MNLRDTIAKEHSRANCTNIVNWVGNNQQRFDELVKIFLTGEPRIVQCAGWPLSDIVKKHPPLVNKHLGAIIKNLNRPGNHNSVKRNTARIFEFCDLPEKHHGEIMNICFDFIASPAEEVAVKAFALTTLQRLSKIYPEIRPELLAVIDDRWDYETIAFKTRAKKILENGC